MKKTVSALMLTLILTTSIIPIIFEIRPANAYKSESDRTHNFIFDQATSILLNDGFVSIADFLNSTDPNDPQARTYLEVMKAGSEDNDLLLTYPWESDRCCGNHYMDPMDHYGLYFNLFRFNSAGTLCQNKFDEAVSHWLSGDIHGAIYDLGWAIHLIQDVCVPHHARTTEQAGHTEYEDWVDSHKYEFAASSGGIYTFESFPDRYYYPPRNGGPPPQAYYHYDGVASTAYDWVDYNAHESTKYFLLVDNSTNSDPTDAAIVQAETIHPLPNDFDSNFAFGEYGASVMQLYFDKIDMESSFDYVKIYDAFDNLLASYTGVQNGFWTQHFPNTGGVLKVRVTTDPSLQSWGYKISQTHCHDRIEDYYSATEKLLPRAQRTTAGFMKYFFDLVLPEPIHIRSDGSVDPPTAPILRLDHIYKFTGNIYQPIVVEKDDIMINGNGYTLQLGSNTIVGLDLCARRNVTVMNVTIDGWWTGVSILNSSGIVLSNNVITHNTYGVKLADSRYCNVTQNRIMSNQGYGIFLHNCSNNNIFGNDVSANNIRLNAFDSRGYGVFFSSSSDNDAFENSITSHNSWGVYLDSSSRNGLIQNNVTGNSHGIGFCSSSEYNSVVENNIMSYYLYNILLWNSSNNEFYHNTLAESWYSVGTSCSINIWDNGYPSGGNYWRTAYNGTDLFTGPFQSEPGNDGIGDSPYVIDVNNTDRYPLMMPCGSAPPMNPTLIRVVPPSVSVKPGTTFSVNLTYDALPQNQGAAGLSFRLAWNTSVLECLSAQEFMFHSATPEGHWDNIWKLKDLINNTGGYFDYAYTWQDTNQAVVDGYAPIYGSGIVAALTFRSLAEGETALHLTDLKCGDLNANSISMTPMHGRIGVTQFTIRISPLPVAVKPGTTFPVNVTFENPPLNPRVVGLSYVLKWNASVLECLSMEEVIFHNATPQDHWDNIWRLKHDINNTAGYLQYAYTWQDTSQAVMDGYAPISNGEVVATLTFKSLRTGQTTLSLQDVKCGDLEASPIPILQANGKVAVTWSTIRVLPETLVALPGTTFFVNITFENLPQGSSGAAGCSFTLSWNSSILSCESMQEVAFHNAAPQWAWSNIWMLKNVVNNTGGYAEYAYTWQDSNQAVQDGYAFISGNGTWATLTFTSLGQGEMPLHLMYVKCGDIIPTEIPLAPFDGTVIVATANIAVVNASLPKRIVCPPYPQNVSIIIENNGPEIATLVRVFANNSMIGTKTLLLPSHANLTSDISWNMTDIVFGNYMLSVVADPVPDETQTTDNTLDCGWIVVTIPGDVNGDFIVDIYDAILLANAYNSQPNSPNWKPNADINSDNIVDIYDAILLANNYNQHYP